MACGTESERQSREIEEDFFELKLKFEHILGKIRKDRWESMADRQWQQEQEQSKSSLKWQAVSILVSSNQILNLVKYLIK